MFRHLVLAACFILSGALIAQAQTTVPQPPVLPGAPTSPSAPPQQQTPPPLPQDDDQGQNEKGPPPSPYQISLVGTWDGILSGPYGYSERHFIIFYDNGVFDQYITGLYQMQGRYQPIFNVRVWGLYSINATDPDAGFILAQPQGAQPAEICYSGSPCQKIPLTPVQTPFTLDQAGDLVLQTAAGLEGALKKIK